MMSHAMVQLKFIVPVVLMTPPNFIKLPVNA
jgi:hypothetical protein